MIRRMMLTGFAVAIAASAAQAADWPCIQRKVPTISLASFWNGPSLDAARGKWKDDPTLRDLVDVLAARRTPLDEAEGRTVEFAATAKPEQLLGLVAGLYETLNRERSEVIGGIERYGTKQLGMAEAIRKLEKESRAAKTATDGRYEDLNEQFLWQTRIFDERQKSLAYVCEVPGIIERRLFDLAKKIEARVK